MKTKFSAVAIASLAGLIAATSLASANTVNYYDPAEGEFVRVPAVTAPAQPDTANYNMAKSFYDPAESEVVTVNVGSTPAPQVAATHNDGIPLDQN